MATVAPEYIAMKAIRERVGRRLVIVSGILLLERLWRAIWPAAALTGGYAALALLGMLAALPGWLSGTVFSLVVLLAFLLLISRLVKVRLPGEAEARRRLEADNGVGHRPLDTLHDSPAMLPGGGALWRLHRERAARAADSMNPGLPRLSLVSDDPRALRAIVLLGLFIGALRAGPEAGERLSAAFMAPFAVSGPLSLDAWIAPPGYTGKPAILLGLEGERGRAMDEITVPSGSVLGARVAGVERLSLHNDNLRLAQAHGDGGSTALEIPITESGDYVLKAGGQKRRLPPIRVIPDQPPVAGFSGLPATTERFSLRVDYTLFDDYSVTSARLEISRPDNALPDLAIDLGGAGTNGEPRALRHYVDLTAHPLAGEEVEARIIAEDAIGQTGISDALGFRLPERKFNHPVARRLVAFRKDLFRMPEQVMRRADELDAIARDIDSYDRDLTIFAAIRSAFWRLVAASPGDDISDIGALLWRTALRLEEGDLGFAAERLRDALSDFEEALSGDGSDIDAAADALLAGMQNFLGSLASGAEGGQGQLPAGMEGGAGVVGSDAIAQMIREMRDRAAAGDRAGAQEMLEALRDLVENARMAPPLSAEDRARLEAMERAASDLEKLARDQRETLNETGRQMLMNRQMERQGMAPRDFGDLGARQGEIRKGLGDLMEMLGQNGLPAPERLGEADGGMARAGEALGRNSAETAIGSQLEAMRALEAAAESMRGQLEQALARLPGTTGTDPLGRPQPGLMTRGYELPDKADGRAVEEILETLRARLSDPGIPEIERDYIRRLLRRF